MDGTLYDLWTVMHGMGFGALFMLAFSGALAELYRMSVPGAAPIKNKTNEKALNFYPRGNGRACVDHCLHGCVAVLSPLVSRGSTCRGCRSSLSIRGQLLLSSARTSGWHNISMEWKEHLFGRPDRNNYGRVCDHEIWASDNLPSEYAHRCSRLHFSSFRHHWDFWNIRCALEQVRARPGWRHHHSNTRRIVRECAGRRGRGSVERSGRSGDS